MDSSGTGSDSRSLDGCESILRYLFTEVSIFYKSKWQVPGCRIKRSCDLGLSPLKRPACIRHQYPRFRYQSHHDHQNQKSSSIPPLPSSCGQDLYEAKLVNAKDMAACGCVFHHPWYCCISYPRSYFLPHRILHWYFRECTNTAL